MIDKNSKIPIYIQIAESMKMLIEPMEDESLFYSENELTDMYDVSRATIRHAIDQLVNENILNKQRGLGTFVTSRRINPDVNEFYSFSEFTKKTNKPQTTVILDFEIITANEKIQRKLELEKGAKVYKITRLRSTDEAPIIYQTVHIPLSSVPSLNREDLEKNGLYSTLIEDNNIYITTFDDTFKVGSATKVESNYLEIENGSPIMSIERISKGREVPIEYTVSIASGRYFEFKIRLEGEGMKLYNKKRV